MKKKDIEGELVNDLKKQNTGDTYDFKVPEHLEKKNVAYYSIILDLETCREALNKLLELNEDIIQTSLFTSVVILYGKCFTDSTKMKYPKLEPNILDSQEPELKIFHERIMSMRNNFIAHRSETEHEFGKAYFQINPKTMQWGIKVGLQRRHSFEAEEIPGYLKLVDYLIEATTQKYIKVGNKVLMHIFDPSGENIYDLEMISHPNPELEKYIKNLNKKNK